MAELVVVANRGPTVRLDQSGGFVVGGGAGGLTPSLFRALEGSGAAWVCAALSADERVAAARGVPVEAARGLELCFVEIDDATQHGAYDVIASGTLWFVHHGLFDLARRPLFDRHWHQAWELYRNYNAAFAEKVMQVASPDATVVVNDYHLALVGTLLAAERPDLHTVHFAHTPFATRDALSVIPERARTELLHGLECFGAVGFHVPRWADAYLSSAARGASAFVAPLGVDAGALAASSATPLVRAARAALIERTEGRQLIARNDRIELSKNILRGFLGFSELLERQPERRGRVQFVARGYLSRTGLAEYLAYANEVTSAAERVNERFGAPGYEPIVLEIADDQPGSVALLTASDVLLVNPVRDGMNLVAKEGAVLSENDSVLCLSREAGAFDELGSDAVPIEPFDISGTAAALATALDMGRDERRRRAVALREASVRLPPARWLDEVIGHARRPKRPDG